jgi:two-component system response regulator DctR
MPDPSIVYVVDDDEAIRDSLAFLFDSRGMKVQAFPSAERFLAEFVPGSPGCLVLDVRMDGMSGLELHDRLLAMHEEMPVLFLTGHGDVPMAVSSIKKGAVEFLQKPFSDNDLADRVARCLELDRQRRESRAGQEGMAARLATLTPREREVMKLVLAGKYNKVIADELGISMKTVEVHRSRVFEKMGVTTAVELAQKLVGLPLG